MARLDPLKMEELSPKQKVLHAEILQSRKRVSGPFAIWLRNPAMAEAANKLMLSMREDGKLEKRLYELIVMIVARYWSVQYAWAAHEAAAAAAGLSADVIDAIRHNRKPDFKRDDERLIFQTVSELLERKPLSQSTYHRLVKQFGLDLAIEIMSIAGFYSMVATVLNGFDVPTPNGERPFE